MIAINRAKAEQLVWCRIRTDRDLALIELDVKFIRAQEEGADTSQIISDKQALRDVTQKDLSALSIEDLAKLTLEQALAL